MQSNPQKHQILSHFLYRQLSQKGATRICTVDRILLVPSPCDNQDRTHSDPAATVRTHGDCILFAYLVTMVVHAVSPIPACPCNCNAPTVPFFNTDACNICPGAVASSQYILHVLPRNLCLYGLCLSIAYPRQYNDIQLPGLEQSWAASSRCDY